MLKWMKVVVLLAGGLGVLAFFLPYVVFEVGPGPVDGSAYRLLVGFEDPRFDKLRAMEAPQCGHAPDTGVYECSYDSLPDKHSGIPFFFLSTLVFLVTGAHSIWRKRMDVISGLFVIGGSLLAVGAWLHVVNHTNKAWVHPSIGATLLGISGLLALGPAIAIIYWREPDPIPLFKIRVPMARVVRR